MWKFWDHFQLELFLNFPCVASDITTTSVVWNNFLPFNTLSDPPICERHAGCPSGPWEQFTTCRIFALGWEAAGEEHQHHEGSGCPGQRWDAGRWAAGHLLCARGNWTNKLKKNKKRPQDCLDVQSTGWTHSQAQHTPHSTPRFPSQYRIVIVSSESPASMAHHQQEAACTSVRSFGSWL